MRQLCVCCCSVGAAERQLSSGGVLGHDLSFKAAFSQSSAKGKRWRRRRKRWVGKPYLGLMIPFITFNLSDEGELLLLLLGGCNLLSRWQCLQLWNEMTPLQSLQVYRTILREKRSDSSPRRCPNRRREASHVEIIATCFQHHHSPWSRCGRIENQFRSLAARKPPRARVR